MNTTVPAPAIAAICGTLVLSILFPMILWVVLGRKQKGFSKAVAVGTLGFFVPQVLIRLPLLQFLSVQPWFVTFSGISTVLYVFVMALTAGLFETAGRALVFRFLIKKPLSHRIGLAVGLGHGGFESVVLVGINYCFYLFTVVRFNLAPLSLMGSSQVLATQLANTPYYFFLLAGYERACTILFHMALSLLLALCWTRGRRAVGFLLCVGAHTLLDFIIPLANIYTNLWVTYGLLTLAAIISVGFMIQTARPKRIFT